LDDLGDLEGSKEGYFKAKEIYKKNYGYNNVSYAGT
jgi:hypothetical protein